MRLTYILVGILCHFVFFNIENIAEVQQQKVQLAVPHLSRELPVTWHPESNNSLTFTIKITKPPYYSGGDLYATLSGVTNYTGACGNCLTARSLNPDLVLFCDNSINTGWEVESSKTRLSQEILPNNTSSTVTSYKSIQVDSTDYAAYGVLTLDATGSTGNAYPVSIIIPRDINGNKIADSWRNDETTADPNNNNPSKNYVANWDEEIGPDSPNTQRGDGLTVLDEYRGIEVDGSWTDTDPERWDVFITSDIIKTDGTPHGYGKASGLPEMMPHLMNFNEVNFDYGIVYKYKASAAPMEQGVFPVYGIRLQQETRTIINNAPVEGFGEMSTGSSLFWNQRFYLYWGCGGRLDKVE